MKYIFSTNEAPQNHQTIGKQASLRCLSCPTSPQAASRASIASVSPMWATKDLAQAWKGLCSLPDNDIVPTTLSMALSFSGKT